MGVYMRNKATGEIRDVEPESDEFKELRAQVTSGGLPMWEQTNEAHASEVMERATYGELLDEDLGHEQQAKLYEAQRVNAEGVSPEANPYLALTPGEIEAGLTPKQKLADLEAESPAYARAQAAAAVRNEAADTIADERKERPAAQAAKGQSARAGGSDEREGAPVVQAQDEEDASGSSSKSGGQGSPQRSQSAAAGSGSTGSSPQS